MKLPKSIRIIIPNKTDYEFAITVLLRDKHSDGEYDVIVDDKTNRRYLLVDKNQYELLRKCGITVKKMSYQ